ncbi:MAG TPA: hypothetical protein V6C72_07405 [Chroococcales cyanobacterium]
MRKMLYLVVAIALGAQLSTAAARAQATAADAYKSAATGVYNQADGLTTSHGSNQAYYSNGPTSPSQTPVTRGGLPYSSQSVFGITSTDMSPTPSGRFNYGFNKGSLYPYMGVNRQPSGAMLPVVSTGSVDFNTCDLPWCYPDGVANPGAGMPAPNLVDPVSSGQQIPSQNQQNQQQQGNQSAQQQFGQLLQFFNLP